MKKNDLIKLLNGLKGNPEVLLWNGYVGDYMHIRCLSEGDLVKKTFSYYSKMIEFEQKKDNNNLSDVLTPDEIEELKKDYEELRRPFSVSADVPHTDTWTFKTVPYYKGKHPCEKPLEMLEHIINSSSKEGAVVLDCFAGTGNTGKAAKKLNRKFIGIEKDPAYFQIAKRRIEEAQLELSC